MTLSVLPDGPNMAIDTPELFSQKAVASVLAQQQMVVELNAMLAGLDSVSAGGALSIPYTFSTITTDSDPGAGKLRLSSATQNAATVMRCDLLSANSEDLAAVLGQFADSTSVIKGDIRLVKSGDVTKWLSFNLTASASSGGYRNFTVAHVSGSEASPFADGDGLVLFFTRNGDKGDTTSNTAFTPTAVAALNIDCSLGLNYFYKTVSAPSTLTFSNVPTGFSFTFEVQLDAGGSLTLPASVKVSRDTMPTLNTGKTHMLILSTRNGGARWRMVVADNFPN